MAKVRLTKNEVVEATTGSDAIGVHGLWSFFLAATQSRA